MNLNKEINRELRWSIVASVIMMAAGVLAIIVPHFAGIAATIFIGSLLLVFGAAHLIYALYLRTTGGGFLWALLLGIICVVTGGYVLLHPSVGLTSLTLVLSAWLFMAAILEFVLAYQLRPMEGVGWLVFDGILMLVLGILICLTWPANADWMVGTLVGISIIFAGVARLMISLAAHRVAKGFERALGEVN